MMQQVVPFMEQGDPRELPGFKKKSFSLPYAGGEIWFEHLDGIYGNSDLVIEKLVSDRPRFSRPSVTSSIGFVTDETTVTKEIVAEIADSLLNTKKVFLRVCFIGTDKKAERALKRALRERSFALAFINDFEEAKDWLIGEG